MDVNVERAEDVLTHKRLLKLAQESPDQPAFDVRIVQVNPKKKIPIVLIEKQQLFFLKKKSKLLSTTNS